MLAEDLSQNYNLNCSSAFTFGKHLKNGKFEVEAALGIGDFINEKGKVVQNKKQELAEVVYLKDKLFKFEKPRGNYFARLNVSVSLNANSSKPYMVSTRTQISEQEKNSVIADFASTGAYSDLANIELLSSAYIEHFTFERSYPELTAIEKSKLPTGLQSVGINCQFQMIR